MVQACIVAGIAKGEIVHVDTSPIRANVAGESLAIRHVAALAGANGDTAPDPEDERTLWDTRKTGKLKKV